MSLDGIVSEFIRKYRACARDFSEECKNQPSLAAAISNAVRPGGHKHAHQYRIRSSLLNEAERRLQDVKVELTRAADFDGLHDTIERSIGSMHGIGPLTVYDVAHRIGAFVGKDPVLVYLHRGTKQGAAHLGFKGRAFLDPRELPSAFARLSAAEIEDCLCICAEQLAGGEMTSGRTDTPVGCISYETRMRPICSRPTKKRRQIRC
jgi:hypothetical protein